MSVSQKEVFDKLKSVLVGQFEIDEAAVISSAHLYDDLDIDSIDAVDMIVEMKGMMGGRKIDPETFKSVRTIEDVVNTILNVVNK